MVWWDKVNDGKRKHMAAAKRTATRKTRNSGHLLAASHPHPAIVHEHAFPTDRPRCRKSKRVNMIDTPAG